MNQAATETKPALKESTLYFGDNGRCTCGKLHCAGMTAYYSGYDISGQKMLPLRAAEKEALKGMGMTAKCELCGAEG